jgi:hypothetical protein
MLFVGTAIFPKDSTRVIFPFIEFINVLYVYNILQVKGIDFGVKKQ